MSSEEDGLLYKHCSEEGREGVGWGFGKST